MCSFGSTGGGCCTWLFHIKQKILDTTACFSLFQHTAFYFPPSSMVPLSLQRGKRAACFPFVELLNSYLYTRGHSASYSHLNSHISDLSFPQIGHLFFRAKLRHRGRFGVGNPILSDKKMFLITPASPLDLHRPENPTWILAEQGQSLVLAGY